MFSTKTNHLCAITEKTSNSFLPKLPHDAPLWHHFLRNIKKLILVAEYNPESRKFLLSLSAIASERKRQVLSGSWVIHPFSVFRLYYEMWMTFVFFSFLIYQPMNLGFRYFLDGIFWAKNTLSFVCLCDIVVNFSTGYCLPSDEIEMKRSRIAKKYLCSIYFITDLLSSLPCFSHVTSYGSVIDYFALLKIFRLPTCLTYLERTLHFFKFRSAPVKVCILILLVVHYISCCNFLFPVLIDGFHPETFGLPADTPENRTGLLGHLYMFCAFNSVSFILGVDTPFRLNHPWVVYWVAILTYMFGAVFTAFLTAMFIESYAVSNSIENKYQAVMSQMNAFLKAYKSPRPLQIRVHQYYEYMYQKKFFNESSIERFISDKLRKEIKFHSCSNLVRSVSFFGSLPTEIVENIVNHLKKEIYLPQDLIIKSGVVGDCMYFLSSGTVAVRTPSGKEICHLQDGDYFGEIGLIFPNQKTTANIRALECCELYKLERRQFKKCFETQENLYREIQHEAKRRFKTTQDIERVLSKRTPSGLL